MSADEAGDRIVDPVAQSDDRVDIALRPEELDAFIGQPAVRSNLAVFIAAARSRGEAMDHVLFHGPPGLGKTTLAPLSPRSSGSGFGQPPGRSSPKPATLPLCSQICSRVMSCLSMKFTA